MSYDIIFNLLKAVGGHRGRDRMVVGFTTKTTKDVSLNPANDKVYLIQHYVIKYVSGFLRVLRIPPPIKLTATI